MQILIYSSCNESLPIMIHCRENSSMPKYAINIHWKWNNVTMQKKMEQNKNENSIPNIISLNYLSISDTKSITTTARGVFSTRLDIYKWYRHEFGAKGLSRMLASWHLFTFKSKFIEYVRCFRRRQSRMFTVNAKHFLRALFFEKKTTTKTRSVIAMHYDLFGFHAARPNSMQ